MSEEKRQRLKSKEQRKHPGAALNNAWTQAMTGLPGSGCLVNVISILIVVGVFLVIRACSQ
jgi:hypothetical protein